ncbi:MAG: 50S ribosomal protein L21 [Pseudomonadota bacterium]
MFAVIKTGGKQYRVAPEDILKIEKVAGESGDFIELSDVMMVGGEGDTAIGSPIVAGALVSAEIVEQGRTRKLLAFKKRRRQNSRRTIGHRQHLTTIRIAEILTGGAKPSKKAAPKKADADAKPAAGKPAAEKKAAAPAKAKAAPKEAEAKAAPVEASAAPLFTAPAGEKDKLTNIKGIGPVAERQLNEQGITTFAQIAGLTEEDIVKVDEYMPFSADQIKDWQAQAKEKIA